MQTKAKNGISLIVLAITIVVLAILATLIPITVVSVVNNAKIAAFIKDLQEVQDGVNSYIITNGSLEGIGTNEITQTELIALVSGETEQADFISDLTANIDYEVEGTNTFIEIDLSKIGIEETSTGLGSLGEADKYYVSVNNRKVYYPYGKSVGGEVYFSLTTRLTGKTNITSTADESEIAIYSEDNTITAKLSTNTWSNDIDVYVDATLEEGETLRYTIGEDTTHTTTIESLPATINLSAATLEDEEKLPWTTSVSIDNQTVEINRLNSLGTVLETKIVYVNNLDIVAPIINSSTWSSMRTNTSIQGNYNILNISKSSILNYGNGNTDDNLVEVRYDYSTKINDTGDIVPYYSSDPTMDSEYLLKFGKVSTNFILKIPENVSQIAIVIVDKAGNVDNLYSGFIYTMRYYRRSNIDWTNEYAKYTQDYFGRKITSGLEYNYANPPIPVGFKPVNVESTTLNPTPASWDNILDMNIFNSDYQKGLVIEDVNGNQFVWVPVTTTVPYAKWCTLGDITYSVTSDGALPSGVSSETTQITNYGGFYIARYESSFDYNSGNVRAMSKASTNVSTTDWSSNRTSSYNGYLFNFVTASEAKAYAEEMVDTPYVKSGLITGTAYDTVMKELTQITNDNISTGYVYSVTNSTYWGNYSDSLGSAATGSGTIRTSGYSQWWKAMNIYDLAGNVWEITSETYNNGSTTYNVSRGGEYTLSYSSNGVAASYRLGSSDSSNDFGFRAMLFIIN